MFDILSGLCLHMYLGYLSWTSAVEDSSAHRCGCVAYDGIAIAACWVFIIILEQVQWLCVRVCTMVGV